MSALKISVSRKRPQFPGYRDNSDSDSDSEDLPPRKKLKDENEDIPVILGTRLRRLTDWFLDNNSLNKFARMALRYGASFKSNHNSEDVEVDIDDLAEDTDDVEEDDDDDDIQEIKENVNQDDMSPLVKQFGRSHFSSDSGRPKQQHTMNGSYSLGSRYNSSKLNGAVGRELSSRFHGTTNCNIRWQHPKHCEPLISNPATEIEVVLLDNEPEGDGIEIVSESPSSKRISARNSFHSSSKSVSPKKSMLTRKQTHSTPVAKSCSSPPKSYTANDVVKLQEKEQYKLLLEKYIKDPPYPRSHKRPQSNERSKDDSRLFSNRRFKREILDQPIGSFIEKYYTPCRLLTSEAKEESSEKNKETETVTIDDDDDVQVVDMMLPKYKAVFTAKIGSKEWLSELGKHVEAHTEERNKIVEDYERKLEKFRKERLLRRLRIDTGSVEPEFPELTPEMEAIIDQVLNGGAQSDFICKTINNNELVRKDFDTLKGLTWLNDAIINCYFDLIVERSKQEGFPSVYAFNTFFYSNLKTKGYSAVRRWTRKVDIFSFDLNFIPLHLTFHWCLAVIDHRSKKISYYDSMGTGEEACLDLLHDYLCQEHKDKKGNPLDPSTYVTETVQDIPQQMNGSDCGMFTLKFAEYISRDAEITFEQNHMPYFRRRAVYELLTNQFL